MSQTPPTGPVPGFDALAQALAGCDVVDLTVTLAEQLPAGWPTHVPFQRKIYNWYANKPDETQPIWSLKGPYQTAFMTLDEHCGTHFDAPTHFIPPPDSGLPHASDLGLQSGETTDLARLMGPAAVIDVSELSGTGDPGVSPEILPEHIERWEAAHGRLRPGEIVLLRSDWDDRYLPMPEGSAYAHDPFVLQSTPGWPTPDVPALQLLLDRGVRTVGIDGVSVGSSHAGATPHQFGLGNGMLYIELLANLRKLPPRGAWFVFLPLKIAKSTGGPGRAVALVPRG